MVKAYLHRSEVGTSRRLCTEVEPIRMGLLVVKDIIYSERQLEIPLLPILKSVGSGEVPKCKARGIAIVGIVSICLKPTM